MSGHQGGGGRGGGGGGKKVLLPPINFIFKLLQQRNTVQIWLYEQLGVRIEGKVRGFDEFMNLVIDEAVEVKQPTKEVPQPENARRELGFELIAPLVTVCYISKTGEKRRAQTRATHQNITAVPGTRLT